MLDGQAENAPESGGLDDLASFLADTPETAPIAKKEAPAEDSPESENDADTEDEATDQPDESEDDPEQSADESEEEVAASPAPDQKVKIPVLDENGKETGETEEVTTGELIKGHLRQADYTRKTQALAERETQAVTFLTQKHDERTHEYVQKTELVLAAARRMLSIRTSAEMDELSKEDGSAWVRETQRQQQINEFIGSLEHEIKSERTQAQKRASDAQAQSIAQMRQKSWSELEKVKIDEPKLRNIYTSVMKTYGYKPEEMSGITDHRLVLALRDAVAYRELKDKVPSVTKKAQEAPRLPTRQATPPRERTSQAVNARFRSGRANLNDLAKYLE